MILPIGLGLLSKMRAKNDQPTTQQLIDFYRAQNMQALLIQLKARGLTVKQAMAKFQAQQKAKLARRRAIVGDIVAIKKNKTRAQLVAAEASVKPMDLKPLFLLSAVVVVVVWIFKRKKTRRK